MITPFSLRRLCLIFCISLTSTLFVGFVRWDKAFQDSEPLAEQRFVAYLAGNQEVPAVDTLAKGEATLQHYDLQFAPDSSRTAFNLTITPVLTSPMTLTGIHIHTGVAGVNGPVIRNLAAVAGLSLPWTITSTLQLSGLITPTLSATEIEQMVNHGLYINVHTTARPSGEIRGQILTCYALTLAHTGEGSNPVAIPDHSSGCPAGQYVAGEPINLQAAPADGWQVSSWSGTANNASMNTTNTLNMPATAHTVSVLYVQNTPTPTVISTATPTEVATPTATPTATQTQHGGDAAESDNSCPQAATIVANGATQERTFHESGDVDWVRFSVNAGVTYRIEVNIPTTSRADVDLEVYANCDSVPVEKWNASFTPGVRLDFTATSSGDLYLRLANYDATVAGNEVSYQLAVYPLVTQSTNRALIIVAGRLRGADRLQSNIHTVTEAVYRLFQRNGYDDEHIQYLTTDSRLAGHDAAVSKASLKAAITQWATQQLQADGVLTLYMIDHGSPDLFYLDDVSGQRLTPAELNEWLTQLESTVTGIKINVIIEACQSGSFITNPQSISKTGRVIITSTNDQHDAKASRTGAYFSDHLLTWLHQGYNLSASFIEARAVAKQVFTLQDAWLDANGNAIANEFEDAARAAQRSFAYEGTLSGDDWPPHIFAVQGPTTITNFKGVVQADVRDNVKVRSVWAVVYPPDYQPPATGQELQAETLPTFLLSSVANGDFYAGEYTGFTQPGVYQIVIHAEDNDDLVARPVVIEVNTGSQNFLPIIER